MDKNTGGQPRQNQDRLDKRAEALRQNLRKRKIRTKEIKAATVNKEDE